MLPYRVSNQNTINQLIHWAVKELGQSSETAKLDAKILFRHISGYSDIDLILNADHQVSDQTAKAYREIIRQRQQGTPVAYLSGKKEFWSLTLKVTPDTLIPRPETELLVETALKLIPKNSDFDVVDLATGSGAIACAIASERPNSNIIATDISAWCLKVAKENALTHNLKNIVFCQSDWFEKLQDMKFDLIVSNPPYVADNDRHLYRGDTNYEPKSALVSGSDGLTSLKLITAQAARHLKPNGWLIVEHGYDQYQSVRDLFAVAKYSSIQSFTDLNQHHRIMQGQKKITPHNHTLD